LGGRAGDQGTKVYESAPISKHQGGVDGYFSCASKGLLVDRAYLADQLAALKIPGKASDLL
jgi:hypothetical protein